MIGAYFYKYFFEIKHSSVEGRFKTRKVIKKEKLELIESFSEEQEFSPSVEAKVMNMLGIEKMCCRRHFLTTVDTLDDI